MTSNAEKPDLTPLKLSNETQLQTWGQKNQPDWDVPGLFQLNSGQTAKRIGEADATGISGQAQLDKVASPFTTSPKTELTYSSPFSSISKETYKAPEAGKFNSPFGQILPETKVVALKTTEPSASEVQPSSPETLTPKTTGPDKHSVETKVAEGPPVQGLDLQPTTYEILSKPLTSLTSNDIGNLSHNALKLIESVDSDHAAMGGVFFRYKSEVLRQKFPVNSSMIAGVAAVPLAGVAGFMLKSDVENFTKTNSTGQKAYYATASALDATALAATIGTLVPRTRAVTGTVAALSFLGRVGVGLVHNSFFSEEK